MNYLRNPYNSEYDATIIMQRVVVQYLGAVTLYNPDGTVREEDVYTNESFEI
jgi:hypothetical protein